MTAAEYFAIVLPTDADFKAWTRSLFARAEAASANAERRFGALRKNALVRRDRQGEFFDMTKGVSS